MSVISSVATDPIRDEIGTHPSGLCWCEVEVATRRPAICFPAPQPDRFLAVLVAVPPSSFRALMQPLRCAGRSLILFCQCHGIAAARVRVILLPLAPYYHYITDLIMQSVQCTSCCDRELLRQLVSRYGPNDARRRGMSQSAACNSRIPK